MSIQSILSASPIAGLIYALFIALCPGCSTSPRTEKHQTSRDNVADVRDKVKEIKIEDVLISGTARMYLIDKYLIIEDPKSYDNLLHLFDKSSFKYISSTAYKGEGPGEITNIGFIGINEPARIFYVSDHGEQEVPYSLLLVFDMEGNYLRTLSTGYQILDFCYDKENKRILLNLNEEIQFAYLDSKEII